MKDIYYTPKSLATQLINSINKPDIKNVADFCVGNGELLRAATIKWPDIQCYGTDISTQAISTTKENHPTWYLGKCDFLNKRSTDRCKILNNVNGGFDLVLMNPPFSCVGGTRFSFDYNGLTLNGSKAMAFLMTSLKYVSKEGCIYAILPNSVAYSEKDKEAWEILTKNHRLQILNESHEKYFPGCSANIILVSLQALNISKEVIIRKTLSLNFNGFTVFRGKVGMHTLNGNSNSGNFLVHSTNMKNSILTNLDYKLTHKLSSIKGPAVLIPRVGIPTKDKVCILPKKDKVVLSDCVLAIKTTTEPEANAIKTALFDNWHEFTKLYKGTGAKYTTIKRLNEFLGVVNK